ncbi:putative ATP-binding PRP16 [Fusarium sp. NRRL 25303]|nr:putative ATP-binding PRP16 [Fusarium sp. NRRL 25303]
MKILHRADLPGYHQELEEALQPRGEKRRCVVTTNIAESSITVNGISYVVDRGVQMDPILNPRVGMKTLRATLICKQSADQRAKCAGRTQSGICQRLYTIVTYNEVLPNVQSFGKLTDCFKTGLLALRIRSANIKSVYTFDFIDPANEEVYLRGLENLRAMNLIDENGTMTPAGKAADKLPLSINPIWHNAFEEAIKLGCLSELIDIAALVSVKSICLIPPETLHAADVLHDQFMDPLSDHLSELNALYAYLHRKRNMSTEELAIWCHETFLNSASL